MWLPFQAYSATTAVHSAVAAGAVWPAVDIVVQQALLGLALLGRRQSWSACDAQ